MTLRGICVVNKYAQISVKHRRVVRKVGGVDVDQVVRRYRGTKTCGQTLSNMYSGTVYESGIPWYVTGRVKNPLRNVISREELVLNACFHGRCDMRYTWHAFGL